MFHANNLNGLIMRPQNHDLHNLTWDDNTNSPTTLDRKELSDWVEQITYHLIDDELNSQASEDNSVISTAPSETRPRKILRTDDSNSNTDQQQQQEAWNNSCDESQRVDSDATRGLSLMTLLMESAVAISVDNLGEARRILLEISESASPYAPSCAERVVAYFAQAMTSRVVSRWLGNYSPALPSALNYQNAFIHRAFTAFNVVSPLVKFAHFTCNQAIIEALHRRPLVHVIDLDAMQGLQWPALLHLLATRPEGPPERVTLTAVGPSPETLLSAGRNLAGFAKRLGISFEFNPVPKSPGETLHPSTLRLRRGETLAVHWLRHCLYDAIGSDRKTINTIAGLKPRIFTLVEQDMMSHGGSFLDRFVGSLHYYSTMFDSVGAWSSVEDENRHLVESCLLYRAISNVLAVGGPTRSGEERVGSWRGELAASGALAQVAMSGSAMGQAQLILNMGAGGGYSLAQEEGCIRVGWKGTSLYSASAWTCLAYSNSSSSTSLHF